MGIRSPARFGWVHLSPRTLQVPVEAGPWSERYRSAPQGIGTMSSPQAVEQDAPTVVVVIPSA